MKAVIIEETGKAALVDIKQQSLRPDFVRVRTKAVANNPTDFHHTAGVGPVGHILGCDFSGVVEDIGEDCKNTNVKKGDRNNSEDGAFAEFALVKDGHLARIPDSMSFEDAATFGVGATTVGQTLYMTMKLPLPTEPTKTPFPILIYGGSTATGTLAIQYAKLSGLTVITTCSPKNFELVKSRGADAVFDYHDPTCGEQIREYTNSALHHILDTISTKESFKICAEAFPPSSPKSTNEELKFVGLLPIDDFPRRDEPNVKAIATLSYTTVGQAFSKFGMEFPAMKEHFEFGVMFWKLHEKLLAEGKIKPHPIIVKDHGLAGIPDGILEISQGKLSAAKFVYRVDETPTDALESVVSNAEAKKVSGGPDLNKSEWLT